MNWVLIAAVAAQLINPAHLGLTTTLTTGSVKTEFQATQISTQKEPSSLRRIPCTTNTDEIQGANEILANIGSTDMASSRTVPVIDSLVYYIVLTAQGEPVAYDINIPGLKESVSIDATKTVMAAAYDDPRLSSWPSAEKLELYKLFGEDPNFETIVQQVRDAKGLRPTNEVTWEQVRQLTQDVAVKYLQDKGLIPDPDSDQP